MVLVFSDKEPNEDTDCDETKDDEIFHLLFIGIRLSFSFCCGFDIAGLRDFFLNESYEFIRSRGNASGPISGFGFGRDDFANDSSGNDVRDDSACSASGCYSAFVLIGSDEKQNAVIYLFLTNAPCLKESHGIVKNIRALKRGYGYDADFPSGRVFELLETLFKRLMRLRIDDVCVIGDESVLFREIESAETDDCYSEREYHTRFAQNDIGHENSLSPCG